MESKRSAQLFARAQTLFPGGVNSPVRAFRAVGSQPRFIERGEGAYIWDVDGNRYVDYVLSWGPFILGHAAPEVVAAIQKTAALGTSFGMPCPLELDLAGLIQEAMPGMEMMRFVNSGTEATMSALRLARAYTGRNKIIKFAGCYHGHADLLLVRAGSGVATLGLADSPGVPPSGIADTLVLPFNDLEAVTEVFDSHAGEIAAIIVEPVAGNMGVVPPLDGYLAGLRELTKRNGALLVFDEVMTGFRVHPCGAQALYGIQPDLTTLGKVIGGSLPVGAYGGRADILSLIAPSGPVYQAGTFSGNPLTMAAGCAALKALNAPGVWERLLDRSARLVGGLKNAIAETGVSACVQAVGTMFTVFFSGQEVTTWETARLADVSRYACFFNAMLEGGVSLAPSQFEAGFVSTAHQEMEINITLAAARKAFQKVAEMTS